MIIISHVTKTKQNRQTNTNFSCSLLESPYWRHSVGWKRKFALFGKLLSWDDCGLMFKDHLGSSGPGRRVSKGRKGKGSSREPLSLVIDNTFSYQIPGCHQWIIVTLETFFSSANKLINFSWDPEVISTCLTKK